MAEMAIFDADVGRALKFTLTDEGVAADLTSRTVELLIEGQPVRECDVLAPPTDGRAQYVLQEDDFEVGWYESQLRVRLGTTVIGHTELFLLRVQRSKVPA